MLYIVGTPIGNMEDLSLRAAKTLLSSDIILTEDTRTTGTFLQRISQIYNLENNSSMRLISYYKEKEFEKLPEIIKLLEENKNISLISQSGMPLISDPGYLLIKTLIQKQIPFTVIPGPTAFTTAILYSGFSTENILFVGFFPKKESELLRFIDSSKQISKYINPLTLVAYESPFRIEKALKIIAEKLPEAQVCICREMTKMFEEIARGKAKDIKLKSLKGEMTVVLILED